MINEIEKFADKFMTEPNTGCWLWIGANNGKGDYARYGVLYPHRHFWELLNGTVPEGLELDHICRVRCCVNPDHLEPVTRKINTLRGKRTKLTHEQVKIIRKLYDANNHTVLEIAKMFNITDAYVSQLGKRQWRI